MKLDIRIPLGLIFLIFGAVLAIFGATSSPALYERSLQININLWWGIVLVGFGAVMLVLGRRGHHRVTSEAGASTAEPSRKSASEQK